MSTFYPAQGQTFNLGASCGSTDTSILLSSFTEPVSGTLYTMSYFNSSIMFGTIAPTTSSAELISFTGITQNSNGTATLTGVVRGLQKAYPYTTSVTFQLPHAGQSIFILSDAPQVFNEYVGINNNTTINGLITFAQPPVGINPGGQPNASTTVSGVVQETTTTQLNAGTATGSTGAVLFPSPADLAASIYGLQLPTSGQKSALVGNNLDIAIGSGNKVVTQTGLIHGAEKYATTTGSANAYVATLSPVPTSLTAGMTLTLIANFSNTGAATLAVNGLGSTPAITKNGTSALVANDILNGQAFSVTWDGTRWQLASPSGNSVFLGLFANGGTTFNTSGTGAENIAHGLGVIPKYAKVTVFWNSGTLASMAIGMTNGTTTSYIGSGFNPNGSSTGNLGVLGGISAGNGSNYANAVLTISSTNIILTWSVGGGSPGGTATILWEAQA